MVWNNSQGQSIKYRKKKKKCTYPVALFRSYTLCWHNPSVVFIFPTLLSVTWLCVHHLAVFWEPRFVVIHLLCCTYHNWVSEQKWDHILIYNPLTFFVIESFAEVEETLHFRVSLNPAFTPECSQIDPDHLFENRLHTAEECITCPWTAACFVFGIYIFPKGKKARFSW